MRHDYNKKNGSPNKFNRENHWLAFSISMSIPVILMMTFISITSITQVGESIENPELSKNNQLIQGLSEHSTAINLPRTIIQSSPIQDNFQNDIQEKLLTVNSGDSLELLFQKNSLSISHLGKIKQLKSDV